MLHPGTECMRPFLFLPTDVWANSEGLYLLLKDMILPLDIVTSGKWEQATMPLQPANIGKTFLQ